MEIPSVPMLDGHAHPLEGFGTYKVGFVPASASSAAPASDDRDPVDVIKDAVDVGYRWFDCAEFYGNEEKMGAGFAAASVPRSELFLVSKCWTTTIHQGADAVKAQVEKTLKDLQTDYIDLYLVHWPVPGKHVEAYKALEELHAAGKLRSLGLSNYTIEDYLELKPHITVKPVVNQIEINPFLFRRDTISFFQKEGMVMESYRALRQGKGFDNEHVQRIAAKHSKTPAQVFGRWCVQKKICIIAKTVRRERMVENAQLFDFELAEDEMALLDGMTSEDSLQAYKELYQKCVVRDTPLAESREGVKEDITLT